MGGGPPPPAPTSPPPPLWVAEAFQGAAWTVGIRSGVVTLGCSGLKIGGEHSAGCLEVRELSASLPSTSLTGKPPWPRSQKGTCQCPPACGHGSHPPQISPWPSQLPRPCLGMNFLPVASQCRAGGGGGVGQRGVAEDLFLPGETPRSSPPRPSTGIWALGSQWSCSLL